MKKTILTVVMLFAGIFAYSQSLEVVTIELLPATIDEFVQLRDTKALSPEGGAAIFVVAMNMAVKSPEISESVFTIALDRSLLVQKAGGYKGFAPARSFYDYVRSYLLPKDYLARSYILGTTPETQYTLPSGPLEIEISTNKYSVRSESEIKVFVSCSGADTPRPLTVVRNNRGIWKVKEASSLFVGIRPPVVPMDDDI